MDKEQLIKRLESYLDKYQRPESISESFKDLFMSGECRIQVIESNDSTQITQEEREEFIQWLKDKKLYIES